MSATRRRGRTVVVRNGRRYTVCGRRSRRPVEDPGPRRQQGAGLLPRATLLLIALFCAILLRWPPDAPRDPQHRTPTVAVDRFTIEDFANASR